MKKTYLLITAAVVTVVIFCLDGLMNTAYTRSAGAPAGYCGNTATCASCHGSVHKQTGWITSNIPPTGYIPGVTYSITATAKCPKYTNKNIFGFEISPQNASKALMGTMILTNTSQTQLISSGLYITHTTAGHTGAAGSKTWSFNWKAPVKGSGALTFYGAFLGADGNGADNAADSTYTSTLAVAEDITAGIAHPGIVENKFHVFPSPVSDIINVYYSSPFVQQKEGVVSVFNIRGQQVIEKNIVIIPGDNQYNLDASGLSKGVYMVRVITGEEEGPALKFVKE